MSSLTLALGGGVIAAIVIGVIVLIVIFMIVGIYNNLTSLRERYKNGFSQIEVQLQRRYDLIPNLVETAKGYMEHERETLEAVISARNQASAALNTASQNPGDNAAIGGLIGAEGALAGAMGRLNVVMEAYPDLKANQNMMQLSEELTTTENKVAFARQAYNDGVTMYNIARKKFPAVMFAGMVGHSEDGKLLEFDSKKIEEAPKVSF